MDRSQVDRFNATLGRRERRVRERTGPLRLEVGVRLATETEACALAAGIDNLSLGGVAVRCARLYPVGSRVLVSFRIGGQKTFAEGVVRWGRLLPASGAGDKSRNGLGIQFAAIPRRLKALLVEIVAEPGA